MTGVQTCALPISEPEIEAITEPEPEAEVNNRKAEQEIQNLKKTNEQITENIEKIKEDKKTVEFENWLNNLKKEATMLYNDGTSISFEHLYRANEWSKLKTELEELNFRETKATFDRIHSFSFSSSLYI